MARDAIDAAVDLLVTADPAIVSYAVQRGEYQSVALGWHRTYVVLTAEGAAPNASDSSRLTLAQLVAEAVRADARVAERPFWWEKTDHCAIAAPASTGKRTSSRVVYQSGDRVAQSVAERLVALAGSHAPAADSVLHALLPALSRDAARVTAAALSASAFAQALAGGDDLAYVLPLPRTVAAACQERDKLANRAPWLRSLVPLVDMRNSALVRRGHLGVGVDSDGTLHILGTVSAKGSKP
jgi:hypothetical protein